MNSLASVSFKPPIENPLTLELALQFTVTRTEGKGITVVPSTTPMMDNGTEWSYFFSDLEHAIGAELSEGSYAFTVTADGVQVQDMPTEVGEDGRSKILEAFSSFTNCRRELMQVAIDWPNRDAFIKAGLRLTQSVIDRMTTAFMKASDDEVTVDLDVPIHYKPMNHGLFLRRFGAMEGVMEFAGFQLAGLQEEDHFVFYVASDITGYGEWVSMAMAEQLDAATRTQRSTAKTQLRDMLSDRAAKTTRLLELVS